MLRLIWNLICMFYERIRNYLDNISIYTFNLLILIKNPPCVFHGKNK